MNPTPLLVLVSLVQGLGPAGGDVGPRKSEAQRIADRESRITPVVRVVQKAAPTVVHIRTEVPITRRNIFGYGFPSTATSMGSGVIVDPEGYVVTNEHVVRDAEKIEVFLHEEGRTNPVYRAQLINSDPEHDLALLRIETEPAERGRSFPAAEFGEPDDLMIGETVIAIGNPTGQLADTVTTGVLSAIHRDVPIGNRTYRDLIQTDAAINPGNSGGPLLNANGELIGINQSISRGTGTAEGLVGLEGIGFAIPVAQVLRAMDETLLDVDRTRRCWLGMRVRFEPEAIRVSSVEPGGPADLAGIRENDLVTSIGGRPVARGIDYGLQILKASPGERLEIGVRRGTRELQVELGLLDYKDRVLWSRVGVAVREVSTSRGTRLEVVRLRPGGPAEQITIERGDVFVSQFVRVAIPEGPFSSMRRVQTQEVPLVSKALFCNLVEKLPPGRDQRLLRVTVARGQTLLEGDLPVD